MSDPAKQALSQLHAQLSAQLSNVSSDDIAQHVASDELSDAETETLNGIRREVSRLSELVNELGEEVHAHLDKRSDSAGGADEADTTK